MISLTKLMEEDFNIIKMYNIEIINKNRIIFTSKIISKNLFLIGLESNKN